MGPFFIDLSEEKNLMLDSKPLLEKIKQYNPDADLDRVHKAYEFAKHHHGDQMRASGEPYYTHPMEVADILADMYMDPDTIITAILHDTIEDTDVTKQDIIEGFGLDVANLVTGVTKLTQIQTQTVEGKQAENFRKLVLAMSEDIRVLIVKLADRLHNIRTLHHISKPEKRKRIARETLEIYAPLAERIGIHKIKEELDDIAFSHMNPEARESILNRLSFLRKEGTNLVDNIIEDLEKLIKKAGISGQVTGREKTRYSIWRKMQRKNVSFEQLSDIMAFRIVVDSVEECYHALGILHSEYSTVPGRFKDFISTPKANGYRSIHTTVIGARDQRIEVQIRTKDMHQEADLGVAAHWAYKQDDMEAALSDAKKYRWLRELVDIIDQEQHPEDFLENTKLELFQDQVYVFSPKGDLMELPMGATPVDFAYAVHSGVGDKCVGAKLNGRIVPLSTKMKNGDQVEIITSKNQQPSPAWERFVVSGKAKSHIRRFIRQQQRDEYIILGRTMLQKIFKTEEYEFNEKAITGIASTWQNMETAEDIFAGIGSGNIVARDVFKAVFPSHKSEPAGKKIDDETSEIQMSQAKKKSGDAMPIVGLIPGMAVHFARCCHPLPGDRIVGIVTTGRGVTVHTIDCETLERFADTPERWLDVSWGDDQQTEEGHVGRVDLVITNSPGALGTLSTVIGKNGGNITNLKITNRTSDFYDILLDIFVSDTQHLNNVIAALRATPEVIEADRAKGR